MKGSLVLISLALVRFIHRARMRVPIYAFIRMHTGTHTQPMLARASPDDPVHILLPNPFSAEPGATGGPGLASTHVLRLGPRDSCYFSKSNLPLRTKIRLLGEYKRMIRSLDGCSQRGAAAGLGVAAPWRSASARWHAGAPWGTGGLGVRTGLSRYRNSSALKLRQRSISFTYSSAPMCLTGLYPSYVTLNNQKLLSPCYRGET